MFHVPHHALIGTALLFITLGLFGATANQHLRSRLRLTALLLVAYVLMNLGLSVAAISPEFTAQVISVEQLVLALAIINLVVGVAVNPYRANRIPERFPAIVQDAVTIGVFIVMATFVFQEKLLTTSAVGAVVVGFALQDTLGNMFAGLAIQVEKPFRVGHWITVGGFEGRVSEVTWRATTLKTKTGNIVVVPNSTIAKEAITNYSEPAAPTQIYIEVGVSYDAPPNVVRQAILDALLDCPLVLRQPPPDVLLMDFAASALTYRTRFWIGDFQKDDDARDQVRTSVYYTFRRRGLEIPYPIQIEYQRNEVTGRSESRNGELTRLLASLDLFAGLTAEERLRLAAESPERIFGDGETVVRQGQAGRSMFAICSGDVRVVVEPSGAEVARLKTGDYFGEMTLLTGDPRTATVRAAGDCLLLEITADAFRRVAVQNPGLLEQLSLIVTARRAELEAARAGVAASTVAPQDGSRTLLSRIQRFLGL